MLQGGGVGGRQARRQVRLCRRPAHVRAPTTHPPLLTPNPARGCNRRYAFLGTARWVGFRLDVISAATLTAGVLLAMAIRDRVSSAILALALTNTLQLTGMLQWWVRQTAEVENTMTSVERMLEYTRLPQVCCRHLGFGCQPRARCWRFAPGRFAAAPER